MFKTILITVDGSEHSLRAAKLGGEIARSMKSDIWLVTAFDPIPSYLGEPYRSRDLSKRFDQAEKVLEEAKKEIGEIPGELQTETLEGPPAEVILIVAETRKVDLIVMGKRGLSKLKGILQGSQSQKVAAHADCPVLIVH